MCQFTPKQRNIVRCLIKKKRPSCSRGEVFVWFGCVGFFEGFVLWGYFCATGRERGTVGCISSVAVVGGFCSFLLWEG